MLTGLELINIAIAILGIIAVNGVLTPLYRRLSIKPYMLNLVILVVMVAMES